MNPQLTRADVRAWTAARRRAETAERQLLRDSRETADPIGLAFELITLVEELHGWPLPADPVSERENRIVRETWMRVRRNWAAREKP